MALDGETVAALRAHREAQLLERAFAGDAYRDHDLVFANELADTLVTAFVNLVRASADASAEPLRARLRHVSGVTENHRGPRTTMIVAVGVVLSAATGFDEEHALLAEVLGEAA